MASKININKVIQFLIGMLIFFYFFNTLQIYNIKFFYLIIPPIIVLFFSLRKVTLHRENKLLIVFVGLTSLSLISALMTNNDSLINTSIENMVVLAIIMLLCWVITHVISIKSLPYLSNISIIGAFIIFFNLFQSLSVGRYEGFFNDPNYFSSAIILFLFFIVLNLHVKNKSVGKVKKILSIFSIVILNIAVLFTASRSGILSIVLFDLLYFLFLYKKSKSKILLISFTVLVLASFFLVSNNFLNEQLSFVLDRFFAEKGSMDSKSSLMRINEIQTGVNMLSENIISFFIGSGIGSTNSLEYFSQFAVNTNMRTTRIHNTFVAVIIEQGVFSFITFMIMLLTIFRNIYRFAGEYKLIIFGLFFSQLIISTFIWTIYFIPFWFALFICSSISRKNSF
ncbi:O-antigen ligase family protein [Peribacillus frigoritolerans]|uniref:O-antigen ligase family protein n=1 Tax=Peribacillus frigoritolerans TaxID=450367 RepID=UPI003CFF6950